MNDFHDWTLLEFRVTWETGEIELRLRGPSSEEQLRFQKVVMIECSRKLEWGYSASVGKISMSIVPEGNEVRIEMQSGDEIRFVAAAEGST